MSKVKDWPDTLALQERLNTHLLQARRSTIVLNKHIRRLKSVKAYILNEKAKAKTELTSYVSKLMERVLDFKSEMMLELDDLVKVKFDELAMIKTSLEEDIETLTSLCEETEKLMQFDCEITTRADLHRAETLEKAFSMVKNDRDQLDLGDIMTLKFVPRIDIDVLNCKAFGSLQPPVNSNETGLSDKNSENVLASLNYNENASSNDRNSSGSTNKNHRTETSDTTKTDRNSNEAGAVQPGIGNKLLNVDPTELAAYINELSLVQANTTLACWLSQLEIQNIPLPVGSPQLASQVQDIPLPEGSPQPASQVQNIPLPDGSPQPASHVPNIPLLDGSPQPAIQIQNIPFPVGNSLLASEIQNIPLPVGSPQSACQLTLPVHDLQPVSEIQTQNFSLPECSSQFQILMDDCTQSTSQSQNNLSKGLSHSTVQAPLLTPVSVSQNISVPLENVLFTKQTTILPQNMCQPTDIKQDECKAVKGVPEKAASVTDLESDMQQRVTTITPFPPGFLTKEENEVKTKKTGAKEIKNNEEKDSVVLRKAEDKIKDKIGKEDVKSKKAEAEESIDSHEKTRMETDKLGINVKVKDMQNIFISEEKTDSSEKDQKVKTYIKEAKLKIDKKEVNKSKKKSDEKQTLAMEIKPHEFFLTVKKEKSLNDLESSSDDDEWIQRPADQQEDNLKTLEICGKTENDSKTGSCDNSNFTVNKAEFKNSDLMEKGSYLHAVVTDIETDPVKSSENNRIQCIQEVQKARRNEENHTERDTKLFIEALLKKSLKIEQQVRKPLRRPFSQPRIPYKSETNLANERDFVNVPKTRKETCIKGKGATNNNTMESKESQDLNTEKELPVIKTTANDDVLSTDKTENMADPLSALKTEKVDTSFKIDEDKTSIFDKIVSPEKETDSKDRKHPDSGMDEKKTTVKEKTPSPERKRDSEVSDNRTVSEKNMDTLISQATWCKKYIQKTLSPKLKKKNEKDYVDASDRLKQESNKMMEDNDKMNIFKQINGKSDESEKKLSRSFESEKTSSVTATRRRVSSATYVSESWDAELDKCLEKKKAGTLNTSDGMEATMSEKSKEALKAQVSWCRKVIQDTLSPTTKKKNGKQDNGDNKTTGINSKVTTNSDDNNNSIRTSLAGRFKAETREAGVNLEVDASNFSSFQPQGTTVTIPINDVKQIVVPVSQVEESWDLELTALNVRTVVKVPPVPRNTVPIREVMPGAYAAKTVDQSSILETHRRGNRRTALKGTKIMTVGSLGKGSSSGLYFPIGVTTNSLGDILIADTGNHLVKVYDFNGCFVKAIGQQCSPPLKRPSAIIVNDRDEIFVKDDICIRKFERTGGLICNIGQQFFQRPYGLSLTEDGILIVLETRYQNPSLVHLTQDGGFMQGYPYQPLHRAPANSKCRFMAVSRGTVIVSDLGLSQIYLTDLQGCFLQVIGGYGRGPMELIEPSGVAADRFGNFLVGDSKNNKIKVWQCDGTFLGTLDLSDSYVVRPSGIHLTADKKLLVTNYLHHQVKIYQLEL